MTIKTTAASVERDLLVSLQEFKSRASAVKEAYQVKRRDILQNDRLSSTAKTSDLSKLGEATRNELNAIKAEQESYVNGLRSKIEKELRGNQPTDAASVVSRRDAADRARKLDRAEALDVLNDAIAGNDADFAHAIGQRARNLGWENVADAYTAAHPATADSAAALAHVEANTSGGAYNIANQVTYAAPID